MTYFMIDFEASGDLGDLGHNLLVGVKFRCAEETLSKG